MLVIVFLVRDRSSVSPTSHFISLVVHREYTYLAARIEQHCAAHLRLGR